MTSLIYQTGLGGSADPQWESFISNEEDHIAELVAQRVPHTPYPSPPTDEYLFKRIIHVIWFGHLNWSSGPGYPLQTKFETTRQAVEEGYHDVILLVFALLQRWRDTPHDQVKNFTQEHLHRNLYTYASRLFIKQEPHSLEKLKEGRFRLICSVSMVMSIAEKVIFGLQVDKEIDSAAETDACIGLGLTDDDIAIMYSKVQRFREKYDSSAISDDNSGFDVRTGAQPLRIANRVWILVTESTGTQWENLISNCNHCIVNSYFTCSNGLMYTTIVKNVITKSGRFITGSGNCKIRAILRFSLNLCVEHFYNVKPGPIFLMTMGDDCVESPINKSKSEDKEFLIHAYSRLGFKLTDVRNCPPGSEIDFCSTVMGNGFHYPTSWPRTLYRLIAKPFDEEFYRQWLDEMRGLSYDEAPINLEHLVAFLEWVGWLEGDLIEGPDIERIPQIGLVHIDSKLIHCVNPSPKNMSAPAAATSGALVTTSSAAKKRRRQRRAKGKSNSGPRPQMNARTLQNARIAQNTVGSMNQGPRPNERTTRNNGTGKNFLELFTKEDEHTLAYLETVTNPFIEKPAGAPLGMGSFALATDKFQVVLEGDSYAGTNGVAYVTVDQDGWNESANGAAPAYQYASYAGGTQGYPVFSSLNSTTGAATFPSAGTAIGAIHTGTQLPQIEAAWNAQTRVRLVSCGLEVFSDSASLTASGKIMLCSTVLPYEGTVGKGGLQGASFAQISATPAKLMEKIEANLGNWPSGKVLRGFAIPSQAAAFEMNSMPASGVAVAEYPALGAIAIGMATGQSFSWRVVFNYEAMPDFSLRTNNAEQQVVNVGLQRVNNTIARIKPAAVTGGSAAEVSSRPVAYSALVDEIAGREPARANNMHQMITRPAFAAPMGFLPAAKNALSLVANSGILKNVPVVGGLLDTAAKWFFGQKK